MEIESLVSRAFEEIEELSVFKKYPPIFNSIEKLRQIREFLKSNRSLSQEEINKVNVGILAAKALDFDPIFSDYSDLLHDIWNSFLSFLKIPRHIPLKRRGAHRIVYDFYKSHGYSHNKILDHMDGIDFSRSSEIDENYVLSISTVLVQWKALCIKQGNYYADSHLNITPTCLGINPKQGDYVGAVSSRVAHQYKLLKDVIVLKSIAADIIDDWSVTNKPPFQTDGGCVQYFNASEKMSFRQIFP